MLDLFPALPDHHAHRNHPVWKKISPLFVPAEFRDPNAMSASFLERLHRARIIAGIPFPIISSARTPATNTAAGGATRSAHMERPCRAVDIAARTPIASYRILRACIAADFQRVGVYGPRNSAATVIHVDDSPTLPRPRVWTAPR